MESKITGVSITSDMQMILQRKERRNKELLEEGEEESEKSTT